MMIVAMPIIETVNAMVIKKIKRFSSSHSGAVD